MMISSLLMTNLTPLWSQSPFPMAFKAAEENHSYVDNANNDEDEDSERSREDFNSKESGEEKIVDLQFLVKGLELGRRDAAALFFLVEVDAVFDYVTMD
ncbi:hypothetical protein OIU74_002167 [Salix koriyanagi]|uniref:Uncharacterized protein n=1 Tax=Salix koriyanagi TaxID=2511006 RepID=A0A9Q1ANW4_9ROSI|nr:hypothetical protein OIU74_002167 [Salix koriyanagi]